VPFINVVPQADETALKEIERCVASGARGLGELRPTDQGYALADSAAAELLTEAARHYDLVMLFHVSEPVGHTYPGKTGLSLEEFYWFLVQHPDIPVVGAHWGGGLPFYALMPEVAALTNVYCDTAGSPYLYRSTIYEHGAKLVGAERILFGSDYPLITQVRARREVEETGLDEQAKALILGENARTLLKLDERRV
jgi:predicted TIM-barrel fold metal-dependent hydrolase